MFIFDKQENRYQHQDTDEGSLVKEKTVIFQSFIDPLDWKNLGNELNPHNKVDFFDDWIISKEERIGKDIDSGGQNRTSYAQIKKIREGSIQIFFVILDITDSSQTVVIDSICRKGQEKWQNSVNWVEVTIVSSVQETRDVGTS